MKNVPYDERHWFNMLPSGVLCIDFGFGTIDNLLALRKKFKCVTGIERYPRTPEYKEYSKLGLKRLRKKLIRQAIDISTGDFNEVVQHIDYEIADSVIVSHSWTAITNQEDFVKHLHRIVKKDGYFYLIQNRLSFTEFRLIESCGWKLVNLYEAPIKSVCSDEYLFVKV